MCDGKDDDAMKIWMATNVCNENNAEAKVGAEADQDTEESLHSLGTICTPIEDDEQGSNSGEKAIADDTLVIEKGVVVTVGGSEKPNLGTDTNHSTQGTDRETEEENSPEQMVEEGIQPVELGSGAVEERIQHLSLGDARVKRLGTTRRLK